MSGSTARDTRTACARTRLPAARILGAADVYNALRQPRPHRPAFDAGEAERTMHEEVRAGRLDGDAVQAVLKAAGHRPRRRAGLPSGLTAREAEVLVRLGQGKSNPEIGAELHVSRKTVSTHLEHIYAKLGVKTRTEAALFAMRHGLIGTTGRERDRPQISGSYPIRGPNGSVERIHDDSAEPHAIWRGAAVRPRGRVPRGPGSPRTSAVLATRSPPRPGSARCSPGLREWTGAEVIAGQFDRWFGDTEDFELVEATVGEVADRLHLHWRLRLRAVRLGTGWFTVEQQAYADTADGGRHHRARTAVHGLPTRGQP